MKNTKDNTEDFDNLFLQGIDDPSEFAALWFSRDGDMGMHFFGYKNAVIVLLNWYSEGHEDNGTVYPLIFLIRHTIELGLKESIRRALKLGGKSISLPKKKLEGVWNTHNLICLSDLCEQLLEKYKISEYRDWITTKQFLHVLQNADPAATFGKYAVSTEGVPYDVKGNVYAGKIAVKGMKAIETMESILSMLEEHLHNQSEMYSEQRGEI